MTQAELDALPETGRLRFMDAEGKRLMRPVFDDIGVLWHGGEDEPIAVKDANDQRWMIGYGHDGVRYKRRLR
jgi:hypothetical protein